MCTFVLLFNRWLEHTFNVAQRSTSLCTVQFRLATLCVRQSTTKVKKKEYEKRKKGLTRKCTLHRAYWAKEKVDCVKCKAEQTDARVKEKPNKNAKEKVNSDRAKFLFNLVCFNLISFCVCVFLHFGYEWAAVFDFIMIVLQIHRPWWKWQLALVRTTFLNHRNLLQTT